MREISPIISPEEEIIQHNSLVRGVIQLTEQRNNFSKNPKIALVHDWLDTYRGGEKVLEALVEMFPDAPIYTLFYEGKNLPPIFQDKKNIYYPKSLQPLKRFRKALLPLLPRFVEDFKLNDYDIVISSSSCVAKGVIPHPDAYHLCYCHSPMRYIWDQREHYLDSPLKRFLHWWFGSSLRQWDQSSAARVDTFVANSQFVAAKIKKYYGREATVLHPPMDLALLRPEDVVPYEQRDYFVIAGAFVPYKKVELAIETFLQTKNQRLLVMGSGPLLKKFQSMIHGVPNIELLENPDRSTFTKRLTEAKGLIQTAEEDFGITPIEALAQGTPLLCYHGGGARDYVQDGINGLFFGQQTTDSLADRLKQWEQHAFDPQQVAQSAEPFRKERFQERMLQFVEAAREKQQRRG